MRQSRSWTWSCAGGGSDSGTGTGTGSGSGADSAQLSGGSKYAHTYTHTHAYTYRQDQTCLRVTVTHILFINIAQKQLIFGNIPISNVCECVSECVGSVRTTTNQPYIDCEPPAADQLPADCSQPQNVANSSESLPAAAPAHEVLRSLYRLYRPA